MTLLLGSASLRSCEEAVALPVTLPSRSTSAAQIDPPLCTAVSRVTVGAPVTIVSHTLVSQVRQREDISCSLWTATCCRISGIIDATSLRDPKLTGI